MGVGVNDLGNGQAWDKRKGNTRLALYLLVILICQPITHSPDASHKDNVYLFIKHPVLILWSVCKVKTQDPENFDEEVMSLGTAWRFLYDSQGRWVHICCLLVSLRTNFIPNPLGVNVNKCWNKWWISSWQVIVCSFFFFPAFISQGSERHSFDY